MKRRAVAALAGAVLFVWPLVASAQQPAKIARLGYLDAGDPTAAASVVRVEALRAGLRDLGHVEGKNLVIDFRWASTVGQLREAATELVRSKVDVVFASSSTESEAARQASTTIPIVFATHADPVGVGHVASLPRPGGNMTGLADQAAIITGKRLEILKAAVPHATRFGVLYTPTTPAHRSVLQAADAAGEKLHVRLLTVGVSTAGEFDGAFAKMARDRADAVFVQGAILTARANVTPLAELALKHRLPTMFGNRDNVVAGGLMSYGPDYVDLYRRAATYIDKILKGTKPGDLPVEQASKYQLVINLRTGRTLGLAIPPPILARADEIIQ